MKTRTKLLTIGLGAIAALNFASCQDYTEFSEQEIKFQEYNKKYDAAFLERFGTPDPNHDWGMHLLAPSSFGSDAISTRAGDATTTNVLVNRNQWCERDNNGYKNQDYVLARSIHVPGWPNFDGNFYVNKGDSRLTAIVGKQQIDTDYNYQPAGDITEYEINYVSTWFRTHKNPGSIGLHLSDFFIQNVSQDNDQLQYYGAQDWSPANHNILPGGYPKAGQTDEKGKVNPWWNGANAETVSQVVKDNTYADIREGVEAKVNRKESAHHPNSNEALQYSMDYLHCCSMDGNKYGTGGVGWRPNSGWTHINNFNNGNSNFNPEQQPSNAKEFREIKYVHSSGTEDFIARCAMGSTDENWINNWVLVKLNWTEDGKEREGYYLAFDFQNSTQETEIHADGFYSNWIIKITPAYPVKNDDQNARVMCEDLGGTFDFDFNDVVFDVAYDSKKGTNGEAVIYMQAAGGTLPIVVGDVSKENYEAHYLLGQEKGAKTLLPSNVDAGTTGDIAIYRIPAQESWVSTVSGVKCLDFEKIPIYVKRGDSWTNTDKEIHDVGNNYNQDNSANQTKPTTDSDIIPRKFATNITVDWMKELQWIDKGYGKFKEWVKNRNYSYSLEQDQADNHIKLYWYDDRTNGDLLHISPKNNIVPTASKDSQINWYRMTKYNVEANFNYKGYAIDYLTIASYEGTNSIKLGLEGGADVATFAYIVKRDADYGHDKAVHGLIIPIWICKNANNEDTPYFVQPDGTKIEVSPDGFLANEASYREALWQSSFNRSGTNGNEVPTTDMGQGIDKDGKYTYVIKYSYTKSNLYAQPEGEATPRYCDYMGIYVLENMVNADNYNGAQPNTTGPVQWFEAYTIF